LFPLFATGVVDTGGKFAAGVVDTGGNLPPVLLTPTANLPPVSLKLVANLPPVSTTPVVLVANLSPVVHLELRITPRIFKKIRNGPHGKLRGLGETDS
jgi:hypothetical protein